MWKITQKTIFKKKALKARNDNFIYHVKIYLQIKKTNRWKRWKSLHDPKFADMLLKGLAAESWKVCFSIGIAAVVYHFIVGSF